MPDTAAMQPIAAPHRTIADKIRALAAAGYSRGDIASFLNRSYQQVRQVLVQDERRKTRLEQESPLTAVREAWAAYKASEPPPYRIAVDNEGRITLPAEWGFEPGQLFVARKVFSDIVMLNGPGAAAEAGGTSELGPLPADQWYASEDLIAERRREAVKELDD